MTISRAISRRAVVTMNSVGSSYSRAIVNHSVEDACPAMSTAVTR